MNMYNWAVWKNCRLVGYVAAYGEWDALRAAKIKYGDNIFLERERGVVLANPAGLGSLGVVSQKVLSFDK